MWFKKETPAPKEEPFIFTAHTQVRSCFADCTGEGHEIVVNEDTGEILASLFHGKLLGEHKNV